jgi:glutamate N-acetyltransferase / amino-acid N-acetyltransferase
MSSEFEPIAGGVTAPAGFHAAAIGCGIKDPANPRLDLAILHSTVPCLATGVFTTNKVRAAPVRVSVEHLRRDDVQAIVANSGNANACTGPRGIDDAKSMARATAQALGLRQRQVAVCSTGIIGLPLPVERIEPRIPELCAALHPGGGGDMARAIMTSDTRPKEAALRVVLGGKPVTIGACAKGAGMICPNMATMLCFVATDAAIGKLPLQRALSAAVEDSFNRITIDGDMSTNDTVIILANGTAGNRRIAAGSGDEKFFRKALAAVLLKLAKAIVADGERVTKLVEVHVRGAATFQDARRVAEAVANSSLCKCSWNGGDANWGRIMDAVGYARAKVREETIDVYFGGVAAARCGVAAPTPLEELRKVVAKPEFTICIDLNLGGADYVVYTSDLSPEYVDFNRSEYSMWKQASV